MSGWLILLILFNAGAPLHSVGAYAPAHRVYPTKIDCLHAARGLAAGRDETLYGPTIAALIRQGCLPICVHVTTP